MLTIRDLFLKEKLGIAPSDPIVPPGLGSLATSSRVRPTQTTVAVPGPDDNEKPDTRSGLVTESDIPQQYPSSYSSAAYTGQKRYPIRDRDSISSTGTDNSDEVINYHPTTFNGSRRINSNLVSMKRLLSAFGFDLNLCHDNTQALTKRAWYQTNILSREVHHDMRWWLQITLRHALYFI